MKKIFRKIMIDQVQADLDDPINLIKNPAPKSGWIKIIRTVLGMSTYQLAKRLRCSQANIITLEARERKKNISLAMLEKTAEAMNCRLVYFFVPNKPFNELLEAQARIVAQKQLRPIGHSMELEDQGLTMRQKKQQEDELVAELLQGNPRNLWKETSPHSLGV